MGSELPDSASNPLVQAPAVRYPLSAPIFLYRALVLMLCLALCMDLAWLAMATPGDWRPWVGLLVTAGAAGYARWHFPLTQSGQLGWDGVAWWWEGSGDPQRGVVHLRMDIQSGLLVRFVVETGVSRWLWLAQSSEPGQWLAVRRAMVADAQRRAVTAASTQAAHP